MPHQHQRTLSDHTLLHSITQTTSLLQTNMKRSLSSPSPSATNISDVHRILEKQTSNSHDYTFACSLAALLNDIYRLLELNSSNHLVSPITRGISLLHAQVSQCQSERAHMDDTTEMKMLWDEMDHLMHIVNGFLLQLPPAYAELPPPTYSVFAENGQDLNSLLNAIDRLAVVAPRLNNQRVGLTTRQVDALAAATLGKTIERLSCRRMENQRAFLPEKSRQEILHELMQQVQTSASRSLDNQRVTLTKAQQRKMDIASLDRILDRFEDRRFKDQDCLSKEERLIQDLKRTTDLLAKSLHRPEYERQRFTMSSFTGLFQRKHDLTDLDQLLENIYKSKPQYINQRASFSL